MRYFELLESESFDVEYYLQEGCGIFAYVLSQIKGEGMIEIFSDPNGEAWNDEITFEVTHVVLNISGNLYDARGKRTIDKIVNTDFPQGLERKVQESPEEFLKNYMGGSDDFPLYAPQPDDVEAITRYVKSKPIKFDMKLDETASAGGSSAGNVATVVSGLGAGFDPNGEWRSIYSNKKKKKTKPLMIRRPKM